MTSTVHTVAPVDRWADITPLRRGPRAAVSAAIARRLFGTVTDRLGISVSTDGSPADLVLHRPEEFFSRLGNDGLIGFGEAYLTGAWDAERLGDTLGVLCAEMAELVPAWMRRMRAAYVARPPRRQRGTAKNSRRNIAHHYDLSNALFATFLDPTLSYSSALFDAEAVTGSSSGHLHVRMLPPHQGVDLEDGQVRKIESVLDAARVGPGSSVLEIGTGWGELAVRAARRGATVRTVTLSSEQQELARRRIAEAGLGDRIQVDLLDYRELVAADDTHERYDAIVSVEMVEAVGHDYWPTYFRTLDAVLAPGGTVVVQAITMPHQQMLATRRTWTWINKYIFPGGFLPSVTAIDEVTRRHTSLRIVDQLEFGSHYAETLRQWDAAFTRSRSEILDLGFDETFLRMWHFYLEYARAGFASDYLDVQQLTFTREES